MAGTSSPPGKDGRSPNVAVGSAPYSPWFGFRPRRITQNPWVPHQQLGGRGQAPTGPNTPAISQQDYNGMPQSSQDEDQGPAVGQYESGPQAIGMDRAGLNQTLRGDGGAADKRAAAQSMGYQVGQTSPGEAIMKGVGLLSGVPGAGFIADKAVGKMQDIGSPWFGIEEGAPRAGDIGSVDYATGDVWGQGTGGVRGYDPITGRAQANYTSAGDAWNTWNNSYNNLRNSGENMISAGLGSYENSVYNVTDAERQQGITPASKAGALPQVAPVGEGEYIGRSGIRFKDGISEGVPGAGTTFSSGQLRTDDTGKVVEAATPTIDPTTGIQTGDVGFASDRAYQQDTGGDEDYNPGGGTSIGGGGTSFGAGRTEDDDWDDNEGGSWQDAPAASDDGGGGGGGK